MDYVTCIDVSVFEKALTRGKSYKVLASDTEKRQVKIRTDNERVRWFPLYCFNIGIDPVAKVTRIQIDDPITDPNVDSTEVTLYLLTGEKESRRWCYFITPAYFSRIFKVDPMRPHIFNKHGIVLPVLTVDTITYAINYLEKQNYLEECTLPLRDETDDMD